MEEQPAEIGFKVVNLAPDTNEPMLAVGRNDGVSKESGRILVLDDERYLTDFYRMAFSRLGYRVTAFNDSMEALAAFSCEPGLFDLVLTDFTIPRLMGDRLSRKLLNIRSDIPIVMVTGDASLLCRALNIASTNRHGSPSISDF
ncbi:MAG: response regulator [Proteobacteria bacterium]|nr:response regulator [Pseudomonadota bacterium]